MIFKDKKETNEIQNNSITTSVVLKTSNNKHLLQKPLIEIRLARK